MRVAPGRPSRYLPRCQFNLDTWKEGVKGPPLFLPCDRVKTPDKRGAPLRKVDP